MLTEIHIQNFKSYESSILHLAPLTVLIGANASGKSNAIEALQIIRRIADGERFGFLGSQNPNNESAFRGQIKNLGFHGNKSFTLECKTNEQEWNHFSITLGIRDDGDLHVVKESITSPDSTVPLYEITSEPQGAGSDVFVAYNNFARGGKKPSIVCSSHMAIFTQLLSAIRFRPENEKSRDIIPKIAGRYIEWMSNIIFLEPEPSAMRSYGHRTEKVLSRHGENLSGVLFNLCEIKNTKKEILNFVRNLPEQNIADLDFHTTARGEVMLKLTETFGGHSTQYDAESLSDGTLRVLSIAAAMLSAPPESLVVIEEIDNGVHPSRAKSLLEKIQNIAKGRNLRVLISSHNPALLDSLPNDAVPDTVFCYRDPNNGSSRLSRLSDIRDYPELIAQGGIGQLMTRGILEGFVKNHPDSKEKKRRAREWMKSLGFESPK